MNGFAALDIHPHRRYVVDIGGRRSSRCRPHINFALFLHSLDFTQNLGWTLKGSDLERQAMLYCKRLGINYSKLTETEFRQLIHILDKSSLLKVHGPKRKKRK